MIEKYDAATEPGAKGALLRGEGLYDSHISYWRKARDSGALKSQAVAVPVGAGLAGLRKTAIEIPQTALELRYKVWGDRRLPFGVTARWLGARLVRLVDAECCIQQLVGIR